MQSGQFRDMYVRTRGRIGNRVSGQQLFVPGSFRTGDAREFFACVSCALWRFVLWRITNPSLAWAQEMLANLLPAFPGNSKHHLPALPGAGNARQIFGGRSL